MSWLLIVLTAITFLFELWSIRLVFAIFRTIRDMNHHDSEPE